MVQDLVEEDERNVQFFLVEDLESGLDVVSQFFLLDWQVVLGEPVTVQDGPR